LNWIAIFLTAIARFAGWEHVANNRTGAVRRIDWYPMFGAYFHGSKQTGWITAVGTTSMPIIQAVRPFCVSERIRQSLLSSYISLNDNLGSFRMDSVIYPIVLTCVVGMGMSPLIRVLLSVILPFQVVLMATLMKAIFAFRMQAVFSRSVLVKMLKSSREYLFALRATPLTIWQNFRLGITAFERTAATAIHVQAIGSTTVSRELVARFEFPTRGTTFKRTRKVNHRVSLSLYHMLLSAGGVICHRSGISLADNRIIPQLTEKG
jgi:hypothetical protein